MLFVIICKLGLPWVSLVTLHKGHKEKCSSWYIKRDDTEITDNSTFIENKGSIVIEQLSC